MGKPKIPVKLARTYRGEGLTLKAIAKTLKAQGYPPKPYSAFHPESIRRIVGRKGRPQC